MSRPRSSFRRRESGKRTKIRVGDSERLEQLSHAAQPTRDQARKCKIDLERGLTRRGRLERSRPLVDAEIEQEIALRDGAMARGADAFRRLRQRLEIDVRRQVDLSGR